MKNEDLKNVAKAIWQSDFALRINCRSGKNKNIRGNAYRYACDLIKRTFAAGLPDEKKKFFLNEFGG